ncbi:MAG: lysylphosphatidylglycerol synthase transmembrane domain-containing protein [bacterium]|nr:lysylphosphatidylglycerol synthase transmembrane domain-containing protein [bacterium]
MVKADKRLWIGIGISVVLVLFLVRDTNFEKLGLIFRQVNYIYCLPVILAHLVAVLIRAHRWRFLMKGLHHPAIKNLFSATMIGFMANFVLPARMGEFVRAYLIGRKEGISKSAAFATVVVERLVDTLTILLILVAVLMRVSLPDSGIAPVYSSALRGAGITLGLLFFAFLLFLILLKEKTDFTVSTMGFLLKPFPKTWHTKILTLLQSFVAGLGAIRFGPHLAYIAGYSLLLWGTYGAGNALLLKAFQIDLPAYVPFYLIVVQAVGVAIPSSPGFVGTYHAAVVAGLAAFGIHQEESLSFAILSHFIMVVPVIFYGLVLMWRDHLSLQALGSEAAHGNSPPATG